MQVLCKNNVKKHIKDNVNIHVETMLNITEKNNVDKDGDCQSRSFPDMYRLHSEYQRDDMHSSYSEPRDLNTQKKVKTNAYLF